MNVSEAAQIFILIYVLVVAALFLTHRFWYPLLASLRRALGFAPASSDPADFPQSEAQPAHPSLSSVSAAPRPPKLRPPPQLDLEAPDAAQAYGRRLLLCARIIGHISQGNPTGFPTGLFMEWLWARWPGSPSVERFDAASLPAFAVSGTSSGGHEFDFILDEFSKDAVYAEQADLVDFCGEAFASAKAGSPVRTAIEALVEKFAVTHPSGWSSGTAVDDADRLLLERKLEVDFIPDIPAKVAHLRRMHAFFRQRLMWLRDDPLADRRTERMSDCRTHMEEHERLLACLGSSA